MSDNRTQDLENSILELFPRRRDRIQVTKAISLAKTAHWNQFRRGRNEPYINHPLRVALRVSKISPRSTLLHNVTTALLHDAIEDGAHKITQRLVLGSNQKVPRRESLLYSRGYISGKLGSAVAEDVMKLTLPVGNKRNLPHEELMKEYHEEVRATVNSGFTAFLVKLSDLTDNVTSINEKNSKEEKQYFMDRYKPVIPIFRTALNTYLYRISEDKLEKINAYLNEVEQVFYDVSVDAD